MRTEISLAALLLAGAVALHARGQDDSTSIDHSAPPVEEDRDGGTLDQPDGGLDSTPEEKPAEKAPAPTPKAQDTSSTDEEKPSTDTDKKNDGKNDGKKLHWRKDPATLRHPGSYIGLALGYTNSRAWFTPQEKEFNETVTLGPLDGWQFCFRTGDAFTEWFAIGFQIIMGSGGYGSPDTIGTFALLLDTTFYPWKGLGIRPSVGLGLSYTQGEEDFEFGFGGPGSLSLALTYEFRVARLLAIAPVAQVYWVAGEDFNGLYFFIGLEFLKWFDTPTG